MAKDKKSFIAYADWLETFEECSDEEAGKLAKHLFRYVNGLNPDAPDRITKLAFIPIKQSLKRDLKKYEAYAEKQRVNGAKGGRPKNPTLLKKTQPFFDKPKKPDSVSDSVNDSVNEISLTEKQEKATPVFFQNEELDDVFKKWLYAIEFEVRLAVRKKLGPAAIEALQMKLNGMPEIKAIAMVRQSLENGWVNLRAVEEIKGEVKQERKRSWE